MAKFLFLLSMLLLTACSFQQSRSIENVLLRPDVRTQIVNDYVKELVLLTPDKSATIELEEPITPFGKELLDTLRTKGFPVFVAARTKGTPKANSYTIDSIGQGVIASSFSSPTLTISRIYTTHGEELTAQGGFSVLRREDG
jgi:hypothetical protein